MENYLDRINTISSFVEKEKLRASILLKRKEVIALEKENALLRYKGAVAARDVINALAQKTLGQVSSQIGQLVTNAIHAIFDNPYSFKIEFAQTFLKICY